MDFHKHATLILSIVGATAGIIAAVAYFENKNKRKLEEEIAVLDKNIKLLQLHDKLNNTAP